MQWVPIESKQIRFVGYDEGSQKMSVLYCNGEIRECLAVTKEAYESFLSSTNQYDALVQMTSCNTSANFA
jgi:predicted acetyltransferase